MDNLNKTCNNLKNQFDLEEPTIGHFNRFESKLKGIKPNKKFNFKFVAVAASILMLFGIVFTSVQINKGIELAEISPKMEETQDYFASVIHQEIEKINKEKNPENAKIIEDAFLQIHQIEGNYKKLTIELKNNSNSKEIIFAMIHNYQQRIDVLQNLLQNLDNFRQLKNNKNENNTI